MSEKGTTIPSKGNGENQSGNNSTQGVTGSDDNKKKQESKIEDLGPVYKIRLKRGGDREMYANSRGYRFHKDGFTPIPEKDFMSPNIQSALHLFIIQKPEEKNQ